MLVWLWPYRRQKAGQTHKRRRPGEEEGRDWQRDIYAQASQVAPVVKNPPANAEDKETWVRSLGQEDPLVEGMATHSSILAENPMERGAWRATVQRIAESDMTKAT